MDYEKAYKEAKQRVKKALLRCRHLSTEANMAVAYALDYVFGENNASEDERIRKALLKLVSNDKNNGYTEFYKAEGITCDDAIAYLEKQKEQKPVEYLNKDKIYAIMTKLTNLSYSKLLPINSDEYKNIHEITSDVRSLLDSPMEQKTAEWSEEDETCLEYALWCVTKTRHFVAKDACDLDACRCAERWLKSLRTQPHWKPSEEQIMVFLKANPVNLMPEELSVYKSLCSDIQKLM